MTRFAVALVATLLAGTAAADERSPSSATGAAPTTPVGHEVAASNPASQVDPPQAIESNAGAGPSASHEPDDAAADAAFRAAQQLAARSDVESVARALDAFERLGAARPVTRWTDDAWAEAARLAERSGDHARARRALAQVIELGTDTRLVRRARAALARLDAATGAGQWDTVAATHERLVSGVFDGDDPRPELAALESLVAEHPGYPRATAVRLAIARGWEQEGHTARALRWYRAAVDGAAPEHRAVAQLERVNALTRAGQLDEARAALAQVRGLADPVGVARAEVLLRRAHQRAWLRPAAWLVLASLLVIALVALRRTLGSVRHVTHRLVRPPGEALYLIPLAITLVVVASAGNPLVARAVRDLALGGVLVAWISGVVLDAARARHGRPSRRRLTAHIGLVLVAATALTYLALDRDHLLAHLGETWRAGPNLR